VGKTLPKVLVIDDEEQVRTTLGFVLHDLGFTVLTAKNGREGLALAEAVRFDLVITDIVMPDIEGIETIMTLRRRRADLPIVAISGGGRSRGPDYLEMAKGLGADATLAKPFGSDELKDAIAKAQARHANAA
jgi:CheY-like chemotaxis protein